MAGAFVQIAGEASDNTVSVATIAVTLSGTTANNLLVAAISFRNSSSVSPITASSGWSSIQDHTTGSDAQGATFYRISDGAETSVTFSWTNNSSYAVTVLEYSGLATSSPLENSGESLTYVTTGQTSGDPIPSGSATPATANGLAVAFAVGYDERQANQSELSINNSYTIDDYKTPSAGAQPYVAIASKVYTTTAAQSPSWDTSLTTTWKLYGVVAVFKEPGGATISGSGAPTAQASIVAGTATRTITVSGTPSAQAATASGAAVREITSSGAAQAQAATVAGAATRSVICSGASQAQSATTTGVAVRTIAGSGTPTAQDSTVDGAGQTGTVVTGSGTPQAQTSTVSGSATRVITGSGACAANDAEVVGSGTGLQLITGTGLAVSQASTVTGVALRIVTGAGALQAQAARVTGYDAYTPSPDMVTVGYENRTARVAQI